MKRKLEESYQYGQGFEKDLKSLVKWFKKEYDSSDFNPSSIENEIKKILKYNKNKIQKIFKKNELITEPIILWYKKTLKSTGKPIIVQQGRGKNMKEFQVASFKLDNCRIEMSFNNSVGNPKKAGASTVLYVYPKNGETIEELCKGGIKTK